MKVAKYRTNELLDSIFTAVYPPEKDWVGDMENVHKMYKACNALLNAPEKPWQEYEKQMKKFRKYLNEWVGDANTNTNKGEIK